MSLLELSALQAGYGATQVLWGVDFTVEAGEVVAMLGPNGAGKTTVAGAIAGTVKIWGGAVRVNGRDITTLPPETRAKAGVSLVPQGRRVFPDLTVAENLDIALNAAGSRSKASTREFIDHVFPKLATLSRRRAGSLSGGEQQMLAVGRALVAEPSVVVFDEPSLGLAPVVVDDLYASIHKIRERGVSALLIEQLVGPALEVADRVLLLEAGRIVGAGTAAEFTGSSELADRYLGAG